MGNFQVKVTDFGIATNLDLSAGDWNAETGTCRWMVPEVIHHESCSQTVDVFSFSMICWQLLTCKDSSISQQHPNVHQESD